MEAKKLKENIDKRSLIVAQVLRKYLNPEEFSNYQLFMRTKCKLIMESREIQDKISLTEEQILALKEVAWSREKCCCQMFTFTWFQSRIFTIFNPVVLSFINTKWGCEDQLLQLRYNRKKIASEVAFKKRWSTMLFLNSHLIEYFISSFF